MGICRILCTVCAWVSGLVAAWLGSGPCQKRFCPLGWILAPLGLRFESFVSLGVSLGPKETRHSEKFEKVSEELNWEPLGTHF